MADLLAAPGALIDVSGAGGVTYWLRLPTASERQRLRAEVARCGAVHHGVFRLLALLKQAVSEVADEADAPSLTDFIEAHAQMWLELVRLWTGGDTAAAAAKHAGIQSREPLLAQIARTMQRSDAPAAKIYADAVADDLAYTGYHGLALAKLLLSRLEGGGRDWTAVKGRETPARVLDLIPDADFDLISQRFTAATEVTKEQEKNLSSPSGGGKPPDYSPAASVQPQTTP